MPSEPRTTPSARNGPSTRTKSLYKPALAQEHSDTSKAAARAIERPRNALRARVYGWITFMGSAGCTDEEGYLALEMNPSTYRPRRIELVERNLVVDSGMTRKTSSGRQAVVWIARQAQEETA